MFLFFAHPRALQTTQQSVKSNEIGICYTKQHTHIGAHTPHTHTFPVPVPAILRDHGGARTHARTHTLHDKKFVPHLRQVGKALGTFRVPINGPQFVQRHVMLRSRPRVGRRRMGRRGAAGLLHIEYPRAFKRHRKPSA